MLAAVLDAVLGVRRSRGRPRHRPRKLHGLQGPRPPPPPRPGRRARSITPRISRRGVERPDRLDHHRWVVGRTLARRARLRRLTIRRERRADIHRALTALACSLIRLNPIRRELWPNLGDDGLRRVAYRGGCRACQDLQTERYAMSEPTSIFPFRQSGEVDDPLTALAREGARRILAEALAAEADAFVAAFAEARLEDGRRRVVRHGHGPERAIQTGIGPVPVRRPKVRDRDPGASEPARFSSAILPRWARRTRSLDALLPVLYLRGVSTGDFGEALSALLGRDAPTCRPR